MRITTSTVQSTATATVPVAPSRYEYTPYVLRTDPTIAASTISAVSAKPLDPAAASTGTFTATLPVITGIWAQVSPDPAALTATVDVVHAFTALAQEHGFTTWVGLPTEVIRDFVDQGEPRLSDDVRRLRKNAVHGAYLALIDAGLHQPFSPAEGINPVPDQVRCDERGKRPGNAKPKVRRSYSQRTHVRPASHDEILLIRLACRLAGTSRTRHLPAAAVALCSVSATSSEAPQVRWRDLHDGAVDLAGRPVEPGREETAIAARTVTLDPWAAQALAAWTRERNAASSDSPEASVLYRGDQELTSNSAGISTDQQVRKALQIADLRREPGLTVGSLRLWAAARLVTDVPTLVQGAAVAGVDPLTLHRQITQQGERALRLSH
jgi:hypothetical protein